jgi:hypothetical protein
LVVTVLETFISFVFGVEVTLKMEAIGFSEAFITTYKAPWRHNPEDQNLYLHCRENLITLVITYVYIEKTVLCNGVLFEKLAVDQLVKKLPTSCIEPADSLPCSQKLSIGPCSKPLGCSPLPHILFILYPV